MKFLPLYNFFASTFERYVMEKNYFAQFSLGEYEVKF